MECIELFLLVSFPLIHVYGIQLITAYAVMFEGGRFSLVIKKYVYSHPINVFIIGKLGLSVEVFCELYGFKQGTLSSWITREREVADLDLSQYLGHILVETVKPFFLLLILQIPVGLDSESSYGFDFGYKILQCS